MQQTPGIRSVTLVALGFVVSLPSFAVAAPSRYSMPWQLRPTVAATVLRADSSLATSDPQSTSATMLLGSWQVAPGLAPFLRLGVVSNSPDQGDGATLLVNPAFGATWANALRDDLKLALFLGLTAPVGQGGGNSPEAAMAPARNAGIFARSAMDNAMFAVNDFTVFPGVGLAWVAHDLTVQVEATVLQLTRVRGEDVQPDSSKTNLTSGLHVGYFFLPMLSLGMDLRYQRWLSTPKAVEDDPTGTLRDNATVAVGPRFHFAMGDTGWFRPGLSYTHPLDDPMGTNGYRIVQVDLPFVFK